MVRKLQLKSPEEALGKKIFFQGGSVSAPIAGVVKDFHDYSFHSDINPVCITTYSDNYNDYAVKINMKNIRAVLPALEKNGMTCTREKYMNTSSSTTALLNFMRRKKQC